MVKATNFLRILNFHVENTRISRKTENLLRLAASKYHLIMVKATNFLRIFNFNTENTQIPRKVKNNFFWVSRFSANFPSKPRFNLNNFFSVQNEEIGLLFSRIADIRLTFLQNHVFGWKCRNQPIISLVSRYSADFSPEITFSVENVEISLLFSWLADIRLTFPQNHDFGWKCRNRPIIILVSRFSANFPESDFFSV